MHFHFHSSTIASADFIIVTPSLPIHSSKTFLLKVPQRPQCCPRVDGAGITWTKTLSVATQTRRNEYTWTVVAHLAILKISTSFCLKASSAPSVRVLISPLMETTPFAEILTKCPPKYALTASLLPTFLENTA